MEQHFEVDLRIDVPVPMRDGVKLSTDLYLPRSEDAFPTVLIRTPYGNGGSDSVNKGRMLASIGYACAMQDCRGRWDSEGVFVPLFGEGEDGFDTCEWLAEQPWCNGAIGTMGGSYLGWVQWSNAVLGSDKLKCIAPAIMGTNHYNMMRPGGALLLNTALTWALETDGRTEQSVGDRNWTEVFRGLPLTEAGEQSGQNVPHFVDWVQHEEYDEYWKQIDVSGRITDLTMPALIVTGWYDLFASQTLADYQALRTSGASLPAQQSRIVVGPWVHDISSSPRSGEIDFGFHSMQDLDLLHLEWFDRHLKGKDDTGGPQVKLFIMGVNEWREEQTWPIPGTDYQEWFLHSAGSANTLKGDGVLSPHSPDAEAPDEFLYDPNFPAQTIGGANCCDPEIVPWGPYDQRPAEMRTDVLCYTSDALKEDLTVIGPISATIHASTDAKDTDWTVKLVDVWPNGYAMLLCDGILRAKFRDGYHEAKLAEPGSINEYRISVGPTGNVFKKGHRIRVEVSSSNFPRYDRNLNTGLPADVPQEPFVAHQTVFHEAGMASRIVLPVIGG